MEVRQESNPAGFLVFYIKQGWTRSQNFMSLPDPESKIAKMHCIFRLKQESESNLQRYIVAGFGVATSLQKQERSRSRKMVTPYTSV